MLFNCCITSLLQNSPYRVVLASTLNYWWYLFLLSGHVQMAHCESFEWWSSGKQDLPTAILVVWFVLNWGLLCGFTFYSPSTKSSETWEFKTWTHGFSFRLNGDQLEETKIEPKIDSFDHLETWKLGCGFFWMDTPWCVMSTEAQCRVQYYGTLPVGRCSHGHHFI